MLTFRYISDFNVFQTTHYLFSYQDGLYSRALIGTIIKIIIPDYYGSFTVIRLFNILTTLLLSTFIVALSYRYWQVEKNLLSFLLIGVFITSPGTVQYYAHDVGRFDQIGFIIIIITSILFTYINRKYYWSILLPVSTLLVLIHEAFLLLIVPTLVALILLTHFNTIKSTTDLYKRITIILISILPALLLTITLLTVLRHHYDLEAFENLLAYYQGLVKFEISKSALMGQLMPIEEHFITYGIGGETSSVKKSITTILAFVALLPSGLIAFIIMNTNLKQLARGNDFLPAKHVKIAVNLCCFSPILLFFIAHDYPRWMAAVIFNLFIVGMYTAVLIKQNRSDRDFYVENNNLLYVLLLVIMFSLTIGPISSIEAPILLNELYYWIRDLINTICNIFR